MGFWDTLKKAKCADLRRVGECMTDESKLPCKAMDKDGSCTAIIIDQDPCGETWDTDCETKEIDLAEKGKGDDAWRREAVEAEVAEAEFAEKKEGR